VEKFIGSFVEYIPSCFYCYKKYKKLTQKAIVIIRNKVARFFVVHGVVKIRFKLTLHNGI